MKTSELLSNLDLTKKTKYDVGDSFLDEFDVSSYDLNNSIEEIPLFEITMVVWYCTDTWVGINVILLEDTPICVTQQVGRKCDIDYNWVNKDSYKKVKDLIESCKINREKDISLLNLEEEFGDNYSIEFANQLIIDNYNIHNVAFLNENKVSVEKIKTSNYIEENVKITFEDGRSEIINVGKLKFPLLGLKS